jgi:hypothetical protein
VKDSEGIITEIHVTYDASREWEWGEASQRKVAGTLLGVYKTLLKLKCVCMIVCLLMKLGQP